MKLISKILCGLAIATVVSSCNETEIVYISPEDNGAPTQLFVSPNNVNMAYADETYLNVNVRPVASAYTWESSNPEIVTVDENDRIVAHGVGAATLKVTAGDLTYEVPVKIGPSITLEKSYWFVDQSNEPTEIAVLTVLPESAGYTVTSSNEEILSVTEDKKVTALAGGTVTLTVTTDAIYAEGEDEPTEGDDDETAEEPVREVIIPSKSATVTVGVVSEENIIDIPKAEAYTYYGDDLGLSYGITALALTPETATYADGGTWSGTGTALFFKLYRRSDFTVVPNGVYTAGEGEFNFFTTTTRNTYYSYTVNVANNSKTSITTGELEIEDGRITAKIIAGTSVQVYRFTGTLVTADHVYDSDLIELNVNDAWCNGTCRYVVDTGGTIFFGGATNGWQFRLANSSSNTYLQLLLYAYSSDDPSDTYKFTTGWCPKGYIMVNTGYQYYSSYRAGSTRYYLTDEGSITISDFTVSGNNATATFKGTAHGSATQSISEISESRTVPVIINVDVNNKSFSKSSSAQSN